MAQVTAYTKAGVDQLLAEGEPIRDAIASALRGAGSVTVVADDPGNTITISSPTNSTDAQLRDRTTHTGVQPSSTISDFTEAVQDAVAALLQAGTNITLLYNDPSNTLSITAAGSGGGSTDPEVVRDTIGVALVGQGLISVVANDAADTITVSTTATQNSTDASLRDRGTHTGTQLSTTISDFAEASQDAVAAMLTAGSGVTLAYNDTANTFTISATGTTDQEVVRDTIAAALRVTGYLSLTVDDAGDTITLGTTTALTTLLSSKVTLPTLTGQMRLAIFNFQKADGTYDPRPSDAGAVWAMVWNGTTQPPNMGTYDTWVKTNDTPT